MAPVPFTWLAPGLLSPAVEYVCLGTSVLVLSAVLANPQCAVLARQCGSMAAYRSQQGQMYSRYAPKQSARAYIKSTCDFDRTYYCVLI